MKHLYGYDNEGNEIIFDRKAAKTPHSLVVGAAGAGNPCIIKNEIISNLLHGDSEDKIIIVDVNGEYKEFAEEYSGEIVDFTNTFINPCDMADYTSNIADMADYLTSFAEIASEKECNAVQKTVICDVCSSMYSLYAITLKMENNTVIKRNECPTLADFYDKLRPYRKEADRLLTAVEPYCKGLFSSFSYRTNVNPNSRLIVIDISSVSERRIPIALQISLMYIWSVMVENRCKSAYTWLYLEELQRYFKNTALANTLSDIFKRSGMQNGIITGITRDIHNISCSEQARYILHNTGNLILLLQSKSDAEQIKTVYNIPDNLIDCIIDKTAGSGLIQLNSGEFIPFIRECKKTVIK